MKPYCTASKSLGALQYVFQICVKPLGRLPIISRENCCREQRSTPDVVNPTQGQVGAGKINTAPNDGAQNLQEATPSPSALGTQHLQQLNTYPPLPPPFTSSNPLLLSSRDHVSTSPGQDRATEASTTVLLSIDFAKFVVKTSELLKWRFTSRSQSSGRSRNKPEKNIFKDGKDEI